MVRPRKGDEPLDQRVQLVLTATELESLDNWRFARRIGSRSEAIRLLIGRGLISLRDTEIGDTVETLEHLASRLAELEGDLGRASKKIEDTGRKLVGKDKDRLIEANSIVGEVGDGVRAQVNLIYQLAPEPKRPRKKPA